MMAIPTKGMEDLSDEVVSKHLDAISRRIGVPFDDWTDEHRRLAMLYLIRGLERVTNKLFEQFAETARLKLQSELTMRNLLRRGRGRPRKTVGEPVTSPRSGGRWRLGSEPLTDRDVHNLIDIADTFPTDRSAIEHMVEVFRNNWPPRKTPQDVQKFRQELMALPGALRTKISRGRRQFLRRRKNN